MPTRLANLVALLSVPLALAVIWRFHRDPLPRVLLLAAIGILALGFGSPVWWRRIDLVSTGAPLLCIAAVVALARRAERRGAAALIAAGLLGWLVLRGAWRGLTHPAWMGLPGELSLDAALGLFVGGWFALGRSGTGQPQGRPGWALDAALGAALAAIALYSTASYIAGASARWQLRDRTNNSVLAQAARGEGLLLVGPGLGTVQLRTRRPLLLDPSALDMLPYVLRAGPAVEEILRVAYGVDFFHPPAPALGLGALPAHPIQELFAHRTDAEWRKIRARFGVRELLVRGDWKLQLPVLARDRRCALYALPR
jgi:hypothetical protein